MNNYFYLKLQSLEESAAFVAALTRFLNYPHGEIFLTNMLRPEIWWDSETMTISLNETAKNAVFKEFGHFQYILADSPEGKNGYHKLFKKDNIIPTGIDEATDLMSRY